MNRRELIRRGPMALLGIGAIVAGVKAHPPEEPQTVVVKMSFAENDRHIIKVLKDDIRRNGELCEAIRNNA